MNWRQWIFDKLRLSVPFTALVPVESIYAAGSIEGTPSDKPFVVVTFGVQTPELHDGDVPVATSQFLTLWFHDEPGDYGLIDSILGVAKTTLVGPALGVGAIFAKWQGDSGDLSDDAYGTIVRNSEYRLIGRS